MKLKSTYFEIALTVVFAVFIFITNPLIGQEDLLNQNNWLVTNPIANNIIAADQTIQSGSVPEILTGTVPTGGYGMYTYQWQANTTGQTGSFFDIPGSTLQNHTPSCLTMTTWYRRIVMSPHTPLSVSNVIRITALPTIANNTISADQTIISGNIPAPIAGSIPTGGSGIYTYNWQNSTIGISGPFTDISGATGQNYQPTALMQTTWCRRVVSSPPVGNSISNVVTITVNPVDIIHTCPILGINKWGKNIKLQLFPNPADDFVELILDGYTGNMKISLLNAQGEIMYTEDRILNVDPYMMKIDLTKFCKGVYFLQIIANNSISTNKIIKQ